jgi:hypothetical protein
MWDGKQIWRYEGRGDQWTQIMTSGFSVPLMRIFAGGGRLFTLTESDMLYEYVP